VSKVIRHTEHKTGHFRDILRSQHLGLILKKLDNKSEHSLVNINTL